MRKILIIALGLASLGALAGVQPAFADCRSDNIACNANGGGAGCAQTYNTCVNQANLAAARQKIRDAARGVLAGMARPTHPNPIPVDPLVPIHGKGSGTTNNGVILGANGGATTTVCHPPQAKVLPPRDTTPPNRNTSPARVALPAVLAPA